MWQWFVRLFRTAKQYTYSNDDVAELRGVVASLRSNGNVSYKG